MSTGRSWSEIDFELDPDVEVVVALSGQGATRGSLEHLLAGRDSVILVDTDDAASRGHPADGLERIITAVESALETRRRRTQTRTRAIFLGQSRGVIQGREMAYRRPDLFKGGIGITGACRNVHDIKPGTASLMRGLFLSQMTAADRARLGTVAFSAVANEFPTRILGNDQLYVSIYLDDDADEVFRDENCMSEDPNHLNLPVPRATVDDLAALAVHPIVVSSIDPFGVGPASAWGRLASDAFWRSAPGQLWLEAALCFTRDARFPVPDTELVGGEIRVTGFSQQQIPIEHTLVGFTQGTAKAVKEALELLADFPD